jgi:hypothetical protein
MLLICPLGAFLLFFLIVREKGIDWRSSVLTAMVFCGTSVVIITETLSLPRLLTRGPIAIYWLVICVCSFVYLEKLKRRTGPPSQSENSTGIGLDCATRRLLVGAGSIALLVLITALVSPPNVWDAMEYHLPRMTMWMSNHSVRFFATPDYAQLIFGPWSEYAMMHADLLWGGDRFVNLVEFLSFCGSIIAASLVAKMLGAGARGQALAALVCATIPEGVLEASGPMNTYVVSFWIITTVAFLLNWNEDLSWLNTVCVGLSAALALFTKGSAYVYLPLIVLACGWMGSRSSRILFLKRSAVFLLLILVINTPQYVRCYSLTGSPLGFPLPTPFPRLQIIVDHVSVRGTLANVVRNILLHIGTPSDALNLRMERAARLAIRAIGTNPDDPGTVYLGLPFDVHRFSLHEIHAGNPLHLAMLILAILLALGKRKYDGERQAFWYAIGLTSAFLLMCALLRWTTWSSRYHLVLFVLGSALTGFALERYFSPKIGTAIGIALLAFAAPFAVANRTRSLIPWSRLDDVYHPRSVLYFSDQHERIAAANIAAAKAVNQLQCRKVAIDTYLEDPEIRLSPISQYVYPALALINADGRTQRVWYTGVQNVTRQYSNPEAPCAVICFDCARVPAKWDEYCRVGPRASVFDYIVVFGSEGAIANSCPGTIGVN